MPSRSIVPAVTVARRGEDLRARSAACSPIGAPVRPQGRVGPVQLADLGGRAPGEVLLAGLGEQVVAGVVDAVGEVEAGRVFGDQGPVPRPLTARRPRAGRRRRPARRRGSRRPPRPARPPASRSRCRKLSGASAARAASQPHHLLQFGQQPGALVTVRGAGLPGQGQPAQQTGHGGRVDPRRPAAAASPPRCAGPGRQIAEDGGGDRAGEMRVEKRQRVAGVPVGGGRLRRGGAFAAQHADQPPVAVEPLADLLVAGPPHEGQPRLHLGDAAIQRWRAVQQAARRSRSRCSRRWPGHRRRSAPPGPAELAWTQFSIGSNQQLRTRTGSAPARWRARNRGPRPAPGPAAPPGTRRRSRRAAPSRPRRRGRPGRAGQGPVPCSSQIRSASRPSQTTTAGSPAKYAAARSR